MLIKFILIQFFFIFALLMVKKLRIGLLNIMPEAEKYEPSILRLLTQQTIAVETVLIKSGIHAYKSSDKQHLEKYYINFKEAVHTKHLDGLILTGAPVETFDFKSISYWKELLEIFSYAQQHIISTLGICWGGIAIGKYLGIDKTVFDEKIFGVFPSTYLHKNHWMCDEANPVFDCPQSRYAGWNEKDLDMAEQNKTIRLLVRSNEAGPFIFESCDQRFIAHLGHPEYDAGRILFEYERDRLNGLTHSPSNFNVNNPIDSWQQSSRHFFGKWLEMIKNKVQN
jgi:homoserine O-succinyltransferase